MRRFEPNNVAFEAVRGVSYAVAARAGTRTEFDTVRFGPVKDGDVIARWPIDPASNVATPNLGEPFIFTFGIEFDQDGPGNGQPVGQGLRRIHGHIGRVVLPPLAPFSKGSIRQRPRRRPKRGKAATASPPPTTPSPSPVTSACPTTPRP